MVILLSYDAGECNEDIKTTANPEFDKMMEEHTKNFQEILRTRFQELANSILLLVDDMKDDYDLNNDDSNINDDVVKIIARIIQSGEITMAYDAQQ